MPYRTELKRPDLKGTFRCSLCYKIFCHSSSLSRHRMQAHFKSYTCTLCNKEITSARDLCLSVMTEASKIQKKAYKELNLDEKVSLIRMAEENPRLSQAQLARHYEIAKSNVCRILKRKFEYLAAYESWNFSGERKRKLRDCDTKELNLLVRAWCEESKQDGHCPSGTQIQEKAREIANALKISHFVASNGWLQSFQKSFYSDTSLPLKSDGNETLRAHMYKQHQISRMFMCRCCNWAFPDKTSLHIHMQAMASGNPGNVSIIAKSSASPNPPASVLRAAENGDANTNGIKEELRVPSTPPFPAFPAAGMFPSGIFPTIPSRDDLLQRLRERALLNGAAQAGMNQFAAWLTSSFPQVDASGVGNLGGTLNPYQEDEVSGEEDGDGTKDEEDGKMAELIVEGPEEESDSQMFLDSNGGLEENMRDTKTPENRRSASTGDLEIDVESGDGSSDCKYLKLDLSDSRPRSGGDLPNLRSAISSSPLNSLLYKKKLMMNNALRKNIPDFLLKEEIGQTSVNGGDAPTIVPPFSNVSPSDTHSSESNSHSSPSESQSALVEHTSPPTNGACFHCQLLKGRLGLSENRNRFLEGKVTSLESKISRLESKIATMESNTRRYETEGRNLREQNESLQRKLMDCQEKALGFLQHGGLGDAHKTRAFLSDILQTSHFST